VTFPTFLIVTLIVGGVMIGGSRLISVFWHTRAGGIWLSPGIPDPDGFDGESRSLFGARRMFSRLFGSITRRLRRHRPGDELATAMAAYHGGEAGPPVRREYREVLYAAGRHGVRRGWAETPLEFEGRLAEHLDAEVSADLQSLTSLYTDVRYGDQTVADEDHLGARDAAERVIRGLGPDERLTGRYGIHG
jgi:hypothetical protein